MTITELRKAKIYIPLPSGWVGLAIFDIVVSILGLVLIFIICWKIHFPKLNIINFIIAGILLAIPLGIIAHILFGVNTSLNYALGLSYKPK